MKCNRPRVIVSEMAKFATNLFVFRVACRGSAVDHGRRSSSKYRLRTTGATTVRCARSATRSSIPSASTSASRTASANQCSASSVRRASSRRAHPTTNMLRFARVSSRGGRRRSSRNSRPPLRCSTEIGRNRTKNTNTMHSW